MEIKYVNEIEVKTRQDEAGTTFYFTDIGKERHSRPSFRLWVSSKLVTTIGCYQKVPGIKFPVPGQIVKTEKGTLVCKPSQTHTLHNFLVVCGFRGSSNYEILDPKDVVAYPWEHWNSPLGSLGINRGAIVQVPNNVYVKIRWVRSGRLYGSAPEGITMIMPSGELRSLEWLPDGLEEIEQLKKETQ